MTSSLRPTNAYANKFCYHLFSTYSARLIDFNGQSWANGIKGILPFTKLQKKKLLIIAVTFIFHLYHPTLYSFMIIKPRFTYPTFTVSTTEGMFGVKLFGSFGSFSLLVIKE